MCSCIRSVREDHLVVYYNGKIMTKINDQYNNLKYGKYEGNRIFYKFNDEAEVQETYDDRIFNCTYKDETIQVRKSEDICSAIYSDRFMVDSKATAHYSKKGQNHKHTIDSDKRWEFLCIVVKGRPRKKAIKTKIGLVELDEKLLEILAKINFLLYPNMNDHVFISQLPEWLSKTIADEREAGV